jgi:hypothetical protein
MLLFRLRLSESEKTHHYLALLESSSRLHAGWDLSRKLSQAREETLPNELRFGIQSKNSLERKFFFYTPFYILFTNPL